MDPILELSLDIPPKGSRKLLQTLHQQFRAAIVDGRLKPGLQLPATRRLAETLGISRNTAIAIYDLLLSEGYLAGKPGSGTFVSDLHGASRAPEKTSVRQDEDQRIASYWRTHSHQPEDSLRQSWRFDFRTGYPEVSEFPLDIWLRLYGRAARQVARAKIMDGEPEGAPSLREAISGHVSFTRAVACAPEDIVVTAGARQAVDLLARILVTAGETQVAIEDPAYPAMRNSFAAAGGQIVPVAVDAEGIVVDRIPRQARIICVSPSHQFPLGVVMSARRRAALLALAKDTGATIIEDDYDSEFRFGGRPLDALQTLDRMASVIYVGTFSKSLFPSIRMGFVVCPPWAKAALIAARQTSDSHSPIAAQETLALFIAEGHLARHVRKMRRIYRERHGLLLDAIKRHCGDTLLPIPAAAGVHVAAYLPPNIDAAAVARRARELGIGLSPLSHYSSAERKHNGLVFGFGLIAAADIDPAIERLAGLL